MDIIFMGSPEYAKTILKELNENFNILAVFTQPDKPVGRKKVLTPTPVKEFALKKNIEVFTPTKLEDNDLFKKADFIVVAAYGLILPKEIVKKYKCINLHASILPKYRGASPIHMAILNKDKYSGVTSMLMDEGLDTGDMLVWDYVEIGRKDIIELTDELAKIAAKQIIYTLNNFDKLNPQKQIDALSSYARKIKKEDGLIDFSDADLIDRKFRAFKIWPGIFTQKLKIKDMELIDVDSDNKKGEILRIDNDGVVIGCLKGSIKLKRVQESGKKEISAVDYINGKRLKIGDIIE